MITLYVLTHGNNYKESVGFCQYLPWEIIYLQGREIVNVLPTFSLLSQEI